MFETEFEFVLPKGYLDEKGELHRKGKMRLATARDELNAMKNPKVRNNPDYASIVVLSSVITQLGSYQNITPEMLERLYTADFTFLQSFYQHINADEDAQIQVTCPHCGRTFLDKINFHF